jgi:hypothetical protein
MNPSTVAAHPPSQLIQRIGCAAYENASLIQFTSRIYFPCRFLDDCSPLGTMRRVVLSCMPSSPLIASTAALFVAQATKHQESKTTATSLMKLNVIGECLGQWNWVACSCHVSGVQDGGQPCPEDHIISEPCHRHFQDESSLSNTETANRRSPNLLNTSCSDQAEPANHFPYPTSTHLPQPCVPTASASSTMTLTAVPTERARSKIIIP